MPIEVKELIVRAWVDSVASEKKHDAKKVGKSASEISPVHTEVLDQLRRMITDKKDR
jgi:hypothetical protein